jgi:signal transduction histidine kinase
VTAVRAWRERAPFGTQLTLAIALVVVLGVAAAGVVAAVAGPALFREHLAMTGEQDPEVLAHASQAFATAATSAIGAALAVAAAACLVVGLLLGRFANTALGQARAAARAVADGDYSARIPHLPLGGEFTALAASFNAMSAQLEQVEATRRQVLADLAHELRTPVATLKAQLEALADGIDEEPDLAAMGRQVARLERLAADISEVIAAEEGRLPLERRPVGVGALLDEAAASAMPRALGVRIEVDADSAARRAQICGDPQRLAQVLANLLDNALAHSPTTVTLTASASGGGVRLAVADDGDGIAAEHLPHIFERFYRADPARDRAHGGSGIGLSIVKSLVEAHDGQVAASSPGPGRGATFTVWLPTAQADVETA